MSDHEPEHYVLFYGGGWVMKHPDLCQISDDMGDCEYAAAIERVAGHSAPVAGRWRITGISEGLPDLSA